MSEHSACAAAHPNIAFIKYWGNRDSLLRLPANGSISMNLDGLVSETSVTFSPDLAADALTINNQPASHAALERASRFLDSIRHMTGTSMHAEVWSCNNFPTGAGIASSASAFAALALAASQALKLDLDLAQLSRLARVGSGSACRSIPGGFVEWIMGTGDTDSYAYSLASADYWDLVDLVIVVERGHKSIGSSMGHNLAPTSPLNAARLADAPRRLDICRQAILSRDFDALATVTELDCIYMHAVMMTSSPALFYWQPATLRVMKSISAWRQAGLPVCYTVDAGPNVHAICLQSAVPQIKERLQEFSCVKQVHACSAGGPAWVKSG